MNTNYKLTFALLTALLLQGCASKCERMTVTAPVVVESANGVKLEQADKTVDVDPSLLVDCVPMPPYAYHPDPEGALLQKADETKLYTACQKKNSDLIDLVKQLANIKD